MRTKTTTEWVMEYTNAGVPDLVQSTVYTSVSKCFKASRRVQNEGGTIERFIERKITVTEQDKAQL